MLGFFFCCVCEREMQHAAVRPPHVFLLKGLAEAQRPGPSPKSLSERTSVPSKGFSLFILQCPAWRIQKVAIN